MSEIQDSISDAMSAKVSEREANGVLDGGRPDMSSTKGIHGRIFAEDQIGPAHVLEAIVAHLAWSARRATSDFDLMMCPRCGGGEETLLHRYCTCPNNKMWQRRSDDDVAHAWLRGQVRLASQQLAR